MNSIPPHILQHFETQKAHFKANLCRQICLQVDELFQSFLQELKTSSSSDVVAAGGPRTPETYHGTLMGADQLKIYPNSVATTIVQTNPQPPRPSSTRAFNRLITANHSHPPAPVVVPLSPLVEIKSEPEDNLVVNISEGGFEEKSMPVAAAGPSSLKTDSDCECSECNPEDEDEDEYEEEQFPVDIKPGEEQGQGHQDVILFQNHVPQKPFKRQRITSRPVQIYTCSLPSCGAQFTRKHDLQFHRRIHTTAGQMKNYDCSECGKSFANASNLSRHKFAHSGLRPHRCTWNGCNYVSAERHNVLRHVRTLHFQLPATQWEQREFGIEDDRDPAVWVETRWDLVERGAGGLASGSES